MNTLKKIIPPMLVVIASLSVLLTTSSVTHADAGLTSDVSDNGSQEIIAKLEQALDAAKNSNPPLNDQQVLTLVQKLFADIGGQHGSTAEFLIMSATAERPKLAPQIQTLGEQAGYDQEWVAATIINSLVNHPSTTKE